MLLLLCRFLCLYITHTWCAQYVPTHISNEEIYLFLDELASGQVHRTKLPGKTLLPEGHSRILVRPTSLRSGNDPRAARPNWIFT